MLKEAQQSLELLTRVMDASGDSPHVKTAANELGKTAVTVTKAINNVLLPIAAVNFGFEKAKKYFSEQFTTDMEEKTKKIPQEDIVEPKASIAGPALQGLAFTHEEPNLKEMYLNLLASSMNKNMNELAHPAFAEIIKQMTSKEADLLGKIVKIPGSSPIAELRKKRKDTKGFYLLMTHVLPLSSEGQQIKEKTLESMINNFVRLGLIEVDYSKHKVPENSYSWVTSRPEYMEFEQALTEGESITFQKGIIQATALGRQFGVAVGLIP